jgi:tol-pal system protein YbgF
MIRILLGVLFAAALAPAHAGLFDDEEARKAILELRKESRERGEQVEKRLSDSQAQTNARVDAAQRSQVELANQIEQLRQEIARLRGQLEVQTNELAQQQKRTRDLFGDLDERMKTVEPRKVSVDGKEAVIERAEQTAFNNALEAFKAAEMPRAVQLFNQFLTQHPQSALAPTAVYWLGTAQYGNKDFKGAVATLNRFANGNPDSPRLPDALFTVGSAQLDSGDKRSANRTFGKLIAEYPQSQAAQLARERLPATASR